MSHIGLSLVTRVHALLHTHWWVMSHIWMIPSQVTHVNDLWHTKWMSHVTHMNESCHTYEWVISHVWMSHVTRMNESSHTYEWVMSHVWMSRVTRMNESCHTYKWIIKGSKIGCCVRIWLTFWRNISVVCTSHPRMSHATHRNGSRHTHVNKGNMTVENICM